MENLILTFLSNYFKKELVKLGTDDKKIIEFVNFYAQIRDKLIHWKTQSFTREELNLIFKAGNWGIEKIHDFLKYDLTIKITK